MGRPREERYLIVCPCGKAMYVCYCLTQRKKSGYIKKFCSRKCSVKYRKPKVPSGKLYLHKATGYYSIRINGKDKKYHRFLMEKELNKKLDRDEVVHHINGNKADNRIENLMVMLKPEHHRYHITKFWRERKKNDKK